MKSPCPPGSVSGMEFDLGVARTVTGAAICGVRSPSQPSTCKGFLSVARLDPGADEPHALVLPGAVGASYTCKLCPDAVGRSGSERFSTEPFGCWSGPPVAKERL